jgi:hypothetical protein
METTETVEPQTSEHAARNGDNDDERPLTLEDLPPHLRDDPIVKLALAAHLEAIANGEPLLTIDEINEEIARRRGGIR